MSFDSMMFPECQIHGIHTGNTCPRCDEINHINYTYCKKHKVNYRLDSAVGCERCEAEGAIVAESPKKVSPAIVSVVGSALIPTKVKVGKKTKYKVRKLIFDSKTEAWRYCYLVIVQDEGAISDLVCQPEYILRPAYKLSGKHYIRLSSGKPRQVSAEKYKPDFRYTWHSVDGDVTVIEEVKALSKGKPYSKQASNYKQYTLQAQIAKRDDMLFMVVAGKSNGSVWRYFQQSHGYPELDFSFDSIVKSEAA